MSTRARDSSKDFNTLDSAGNENPQGIWSDRETMWVADKSDARVYAYDMATKVPVAGREFDTLENESPFGIWSDRETMWVADESNAKIYAYDMGTKARVAAKEFDTLEDAGNDNPSGIWSDRETMWVADESNAKIYAYDMGTKARVAAKEFDTLEDAGNDNRQASGPTGRRCGWRTSLTPRSTPMTWGPRHGSLPRSSILWGQPETSHHRTCGPTG